MQKFRVSCVNAVVRRAMGTYKTSTGLVGLAVDPNGRENLFNVSQEIMQAVKGVPETSQYRINVEQTFNHIIKTCQEHQDVKAIEDEVDLGQIEELIEMANDELNVVKFYIENKVWESVAEEEARADELYEEMKDSIEFTCPPPKVEPEGEKKA
mmetsp:Transcript_11320/g.24812  ORF Transcript_11320/g.24812 Transcript_11320/m.24812 type:complete len:154 (-) Transcript_11320:55-516(-)